MDMVLLTTEFDNFALDADGDLAYYTIQKVSPVCGQDMASKLSTEDDVSNQVANTVVVTVKVKVPDTFTARLNDMHARSILAVDQMLAHRDQSSSKYYPTIPCVVAKSLIRKYQRNYKCKKVSSVVIPICGDKGKQIKLVKGGVRIYALFKEEILLVFWPRPVVGFILQVEFIHRKGEWYAHFTYNAKPEYEGSDQDPPLPPPRPTGMVGVDRNSVGAVATMADPQNGKVFHLGFNPARTKEVWRGRKSNLQKKGKNRLLHRIRNKQSRRTTYENHVVSKMIVVYAALHRRCIVVEKLVGVLAKSSKIRRYCQRSQWAFAQLLQFIIYKAALSGVMVIEADAAYTSQECSRCHELTKPDGKKFRCAHCGHNDHRDANAAFTIAERVEPIGGVAWESERPRSALLVRPFPGTEVQPCA